MHIAKYKLPNGRTVTADFDELGHATITIEAMDALFDMFNSSDVVEVVRCKDCKKYNTGDCMMIHSKKMNRNIFANDYCNYGERADE